MITLGIIGVVAALTMPVLIQNHKKSEIATSVKKFYSMMSQAVLMSEIDNGPSKDWVKPDMAFDEDGNLLLEEQRSRALTYFNKYLAKYIKYVKIDENPQDWIYEDNEDKQSNLIKIYLADGTYFYLNNGSVAHFVYDANGDKKPNVSGRDQFQFMIVPASDPVFYKNGIIPYGSRKDYDREDALTLCTDSKHRCSLLLMMDGWEFKPDYPYKL